MAQMRSNSEAEYICGDDKDIQQEVVDAENAKIVVDNELATK